MMFKAKDAHAAIKAAKVDAFVTLGKIEPAGSLQARRLRNGAIALYWRYTFDTRTERMPIGTFDPARPPKSLLPEQGRYSIAAAAHAAQELAKTHAAHRKDGGIRSVLAAEKEDRRRKAEVQIEARKQTLEALLTAYCNYLKNLGRAAHKEARGIFQLHVFQVFQKVAATPAAEVSGEQVADMLRRLFELGKGRTANKLRAYVHAAYEIARKARTDPKVPVAFKAFNVRFNPAADTAAITSANRADKNPLNTEQMRHYWRLLADVPGLKGAVLRLHLLTGAQRIEQFVRLKTPDISVDTILLYDGKGRPGKPPRPHALPLLSNAKKEMKAIKPAGDYPFSTDGGKTHIANTTFSGWAKEVVGEAIPDFQAKRLRSGVETLLASAGVHRDVRGRLQSHGISGVQAAHYDAHDYLSEKREALQVLFKLLNSPQRQNARRAGQAAQRKQRS